MAVSVMHRMDLGHSEDTICPRRCCTVSHRAGCPFSGHHRHGHRDFLHLAKCICCLLAKQSHQTVWKNSTCCVMGNRSSDKGCSKQRPSAVLEPHFVKQGKLLSASTGVRVKVVPGPGQSPESMVQELFVCNPEVNTHPINLL